MAILAIHILFVCCIVNVTAFFPKLLTVKRVIIRDLKNDKKYSTCLSLAESVFNTDSKNIQEKKPVLYTLYKLHCNDLDVKEVFVGYTSISLDRMHKSHEVKCNNVNNLSHYNRKIYQIMRANGGWTNWSYVILEKRLFRDKEELLNRKKEWIKKTPNDLNLHTPIRSPGEYKQNYDRTNKAYNADPAVKLARIDNNRLYYEATKVARNIKYYEDKAMRLLAGDVKVDKRLGKRRKTTDS
jgi:hypothetical protein